MTRKPFWRGSAPRRDNQAYGSNESQLDLDREAARNRQATDGLRWVKMDLHLHTPASSDYRDPGISYLDILKKAEEKGLDLIAFSDHNSVAGYAAMHREIETLTLLERLDRMTDKERVTLNEYRRLLAKLVVLPAFEFTATFGFHILGVFPENTSIRKLEYLLLNLNVPEERMIIGAPDVGSTSDVLAAYAAISAAGGMAIAAHANSSNGVAMQGFPFGGQTKIAYTQDANLIALEVTDLESAGRRTTASFYNGTKTEYPRRMHCIQGSDAHSLETEQSDSNNKRLGVGARITEVLVRDASFASLKEVLAGTDFTRTRPYRENWMWNLIEAARTQGPNIAQSFHERAITHTSRTRPILHDVVAFANTSGGTVYVGANSDKSVPLHGLDRFEEEARILRDDIRSTIEPPVKAEVDIRQNGNRAILVINVPAGKEQPYVFTPTGQIYVRTRADTHLASREEIIDLVLGAHGGTTGRPAQAAPKVATPQAPAPVMPDAARESPLQPAVPVPTRGGERPGRDRQGRDNRATLPVEVSGATSPPQPERHLEQAPAQPAEASRPPQVPAERPRPAWMASLPPERIKGQVQPMIKPEAEVAPLAPAVSVGDPRDTDVALDQPIVEVVAEAPEIQPEAASDEVQPAETVPAPPRRRRSSRRTAEAVEALIESTAVQLHELDAAPSPTMQELGIEFVTNALMEATVAAEHTTREEQVSEAAETEQPKRTRSRRKKADTQLQLDAPTAASAATEAGTQAILVAAEIEPGPQIPGDLTEQSEYLSTPLHEVPAEVSAAEAPKKSRSRRKTGQQTEAAQATEIAPSEPSPVTEASEPDAAAKPKRTSRKRGSAKAETVDAAPGSLGPNSGAEPPEPPKTGVEIIGVEERNGSLHHTMRDLRNNQTVHNVTKQSARRLWLYAVQQHGRGVPELAEVLWHPDSPVGLWRRGDRAGALRYDLVARYPDGTVRLFYGVTGDGLHGPWQDLVGLADAAGYIGPQPAD